MKNQKNLRPTETELEILGIIWELGPSSVRQVNQVQNNSKKVGYTTTLKFMQIMHEKGLLERREDGRMHIYDAAISEDITKGLLLDRFVETAFGGSAMQLVMQALGSSKASPEDLEKLKKLIEQLENSNQ